MNLYCGARIRRYFVRAGDANPAQLTYWAQAWLVRIKNLYAAHEQLMAAWNTAPAPREAPAAGCPAGRLERAYTAWDDAIGAIDRARRAQMAAPGLAEPAQKAVATLDRNGTAWPRTAATGW
jgi:transposase